MTIQVVIVDDHNLVREGIARLIDSEPDLAVKAQASSVAGGRPSSPKAAPMCWSWT